MAPASSEPATIIRTERGLTISGTRITLYDVMDYLTAQQPTRVISTMLHLTNAQVAAALSYIDTHHPEVQAEYQQVLKDAEALQQHYEAQNRERIARIVVQPPKPGTEAIRAKLQARWSTTVRAASRPENRQPSALPNPLLPS
jgi:uncharacterized protein (DUF433 family)